MKEFSAYGKNKKIVEAMVDSDHLAYTRKFYESLDNRVINVKYRPDLWRAMKDLKSASKPTIVTTLVNLVDRADKKILLKHAVAFVRDGSKYYFFDPNGVVNTDKQLVYKFGGKTYETGEYMDVLRNKYGMKFEYNKGEGVEYYGPSGQSKYINEGGYCMFYNYLLIENVIDNYKSAKNIVDYIRAKVNIKYLPKNFGIFPDNSKLPGKTKAIIDKIFNR